MKDYLHAYRTENQTAWACLLLLAQFVYHNSWNFTTGMSSNQLFFGFDCKIQINITDNISKKRIPAVKDCI